MLMHIWIYTHKHTYWDIDTYVCKQEAEVCKDAGRQELVVHVCSTCVTILYMCVDTSVPCRSSRVGALDDNSQLYDKTQLYDHSSLVIQDAGRQELSSNALRHVARLLSYHTASFHMSHASYMMMSCLITCLTTRLISYHISSLKRQARNHAASQETWSRRSCRRCMY